MTSSTYTKEELLSQGVITGKNVQVHRSVLFFGGNIRLGSDVRIDCHCVVTSKSPVVLGSNIHLAAGVYIYGSSGVTLEDYVGVSSRCVIFTTSDDYSGGYLTNPTIPDGFRKVYAAPVLIQKHVVIGCGSIIMPGVTLHQGSSIGALSYVNKSVPPNMIVSGHPLRKIGTRNASLLKQLEIEYENQRRHS